MRTPASISVVLLFAAVSLAGCSRPEPPPEPVRAVRTLTVEPARSQATLEFAAEIRARTESRLSFRVPGKLVRRAVDLGDVVSAGQVLAHLDPQDLRLSQEAAKATLAAADANFVQTQADYQRYKELRDQGFISSAELERRETALKSARAQVDQARAQAAVQGNQAAYATLAADARGVVTGVEAEPGMVVAAGTTVLRVAHEGPLDAVFAVQEDKVGLLRQLAASDTALKVRLWGSDSAFDAKVREVAAAADPVTRTFLVKADIGRRPEVKLGQTATVAMALPQQSDAMRLPLSAVTELQGKTSVWLVDPATMTVKPQSIHVSAADGNSVLVTRGLSAGQKVVTAGVHVLKPNQKVKFYVERGQPAASASSPN